MSVFKRRLGQYVSIHDEAWIVFDELERQEQVYLPGDELISAGDETRRIFILNEGWAIRYRLLEDGRRQIVNFMLPGDVFDLQSLADLKADHSVTTIVDRERLARLSLFDMDYLHLKKLNLLRKDGKNGIQEISSGVNAD